jgi:hypothetical protein
MADLVALPRDSLDAEQPWNDTHGTGLPTRGGQGGRADPLA